MEHVVHAVRRATEALARAERLDVYDAAQNRPKVGRILIAAGRREEAFGIHQALAVLVEIGFMTHPEEYESLLDLLLINAIRRWNDSRGDDAPASWLTVSCRSYRPR